MLYAMLTLRHVPLNGIPNFDQLIMAGRRPKFTTMVTTRANNLVIPYTIRLVIFEGLKFCGLGSLGNFVGSYFHGTLIA